MLYSPIKVALAGIFVWLFLLAVLPLQVTGYISWGATGYMAACYLGLFFGVFLATRPSDRRLPLPTWQLPYSPGLFWGTLWIGVFGLALRLFDRAVLRGAAYGLSALDLRETLEESSVSFAGAFGAVLFVFCLIPLLILFVTKSSRRNAGHYIVAGTVFFLPMIESLAQLSRSFMLVTIGFGFSGLILGRFQGNPFRRQILFAAIAAIIGVGIASTAIFASRLDLAQRQLSDSIFESVYAENLQPSPRAKDALMGLRNPIEEQFDRTVLPNGMYYLSGVFEFTTLWDRPDPQPFAYGALHFYPIVKALQLISPDLIKPLDEEAYVYRLGAWQTFFGPFWADFGWFGPFIMVLLGAMIENLASACRRERIAPLPLYIYMLVVVFFMPVVNLMTTGFGLFSVVAYALFLVGFSSLTPKPARAPQVGTDPLLRGTPLA